MKPYDWWFFFRIYIQMRGQSGTPTMGLVVGHDKENKMFYIKLKGNSFHSHKWLAKILISDNCFFSYIFRWFLGKKSRIWSVWWFFVTSHSHSYLRPHSLSSFGCKNSHRSWGDSNPRTSDLESNTLAPYQQADWKWERNKNHLTIQNQNAIYLEDKNFDKFL